MTYCTKNLAREKFQVLTVLKSVLTFCSIWAYDVDLDGVKQ